MVVFISQGSSRVGLGLWLSTNCSAAPPSIRQRRLLAASGVSPSQRDVNGDLWGRRFAKTLWIIMLAPKTWSRLSTFTISRLTKIERERVCSIFYSFFLWIMWYFYWIFWIFSCDENILNSFSIILIMHNLFSENCVRFDEKFKFSLGHL